MAPINPKAGEVWFAEMGLVEKSRPVLVLSTLTDQDARALVIVAPLTSQIRGFRGEVAIGRPHWLSKVSAVNLQGLASLKVTQLSRFLGRLNTNEMAEVKAALRDQLGL